eukprot:COSAG02_NODE_26927_length_621_cov_0.576628_1_plen_102_part_00
MREAAVLDPEFRAESESGLRSAQSPAGEDEKFSQSPAAEMRCVLAGWLLCVCVSGFISRYDTELAEYDYCSDGSGSSGGGRMISAAAAAAAAVTPVSSSRQ